MSFAVAKNGFYSIRLRVELGTKLSSGRGRSMIERVIFTPEADHDIAESYNWYESREPGLGEDFLRCVEACLLTIQRLLPRPAKMEKASRW
jgi:hypothetical protein